MHACYVLACTGQYLSKWEWIREIKVFMDSGEQAHLSKHILYPEHASLRACTLCYCVHRPISQPNWVVSGRSRYLWNQEIMQDLSEHILCTPCGCMHRPISQPNWVRSERLRYLWNQEIMPDLSEHILDPKHAS